MKKFCAENCQFSSFGVNKYLWARRRNAALNKKVAKFGEASWRFIFYTVFCIIGYHTLFIPETASWISDTRNHWKNWPLHAMTPMLELYYHVELGCYFHQLMWTEVHRSDAKEMILHHLTTILLVMTSFLTNFTRIGASILLLHDLSDVFLESAKVFNYVSIAHRDHWTKMACDITFVMFAVTFVVTRLIIYPRFIIYSVLVEAAEEFGRAWIGYWAFTVMLIILQILHIFWFYLIARMVYKLLTTGVENDERSENEEEFGDDYVDDDEEGDDGDSGKDGKSAAGALNSDASAAKKKAQ